MANAGRRIKEKAREVVTLTTHLKTLNKVAIYLCLLVFDESLEIVQTQFHRL